MFFDTSEFAFVADLEQNWLRIRDELLSLKPESFFAWPERSLYNAGWNVFGLYALGTKLENYCRLCPEATRVIERIPGMTTAGFSSLAPGTHIMPHVGYSSAVLRCHLGLVVPEGCRLRVGGEERAWSEGKCLVFDDTVVHEAWNRSQSTRIVLLIDFAACRRDEARAARWPS